MLRVVIKRNNLELISKKTQRAAVNVGRHIAELIAEEARLNVLRHGLLDTGFLFSSIVAQTPPSGPRNVSEVYVGAYYGIFQEFGTVRMKAHPFLGPAVEKYKGEFPQVTKDLLNIELESTPTATYDMFKGFYPDLGMPGVAPLGKSMKPRGSSQRNSGRSQLSGKRTASGATRKIASSLPMATRGGAGIRPGSFGNFGIGQIIGSGVRRGTGINLRQLFALIKRLSGD